MALIDEIARGGGRNPLAAFLVGRENRRQRERQLNIDAQNATTADVTNDLRRAQGAHFDALTDERLGAPARAAAEAVMLKRETDAAIKAVMTNPNYDVNQKRSLVLVARSGPNGLKEVQDTVAKQGDPVRGPLVTVNTGDDAESRGRESVTNRDKIKADNEKTKNLLGETAIAIQNFRDNPGAAGLKGAGQGIIEGTLGQLPVVGEHISEKVEELTGVDAGELSSIRTHGQVLVARQITNITGDESGRYTTQEQEITRKTQATLDALKTSKQIEGALTELQAIKIRGEIRTRGNEFISDLTGQDIDILTDAGINAWGDFLFEQFRLPAEMVEIELKRHREELGRQ